MATISAIDSLTDLLNKQVNLASFNNGVMKGGGKMIANTSSKKRVNVLKLILMLIKILKTDYKKKVRRGGGSMATNASYYGDLKFDSYMFPVNQFAERDVY
jgi:hypothetical protein